LTNFSHCAIDSQSTSPSFRRRPRYAPLSKLFSCPSTFWRSTRFDLFFRELNNIFHDCRHTPSLGI
jgi:hypothetical protein